MDPIQLKAQAEQIDKNVKAESENTPAEFVVVHEPKFDAFLSSLHPLANLFMTPTDISETQKQMRYLRSVYADFGVKTFSVREILMNFMEREELEELAAQALVFQKGKKNYHSCGEESASWNEKNEYYLSDEYKHEVLKSTSPEHLVDIVLLRPRVKIVPSTTNTPVCTEKIVFENHLGGLTFTRDQQIMTKAGLIVGQLHPKQRRVENPLMAAVWRALGVNMLGCLPEDAPEKGMFLEGGDFFALSSDISLISCGLRTTFPAIGQLMKKDWFGTDKVVVVKDLFDMNQDRMHLDTIFNVFDEKTVVLLESVAKDPKRLRVVDVYSKKHENHEKLGETFGEYELIQKDIPFHEWLSKSMNFDIFYVSEQQQIDYFINFLNLGEKRIIAIHKDLEPEMRKFFETTLKKPFVHQIQYVPFEYITAMYGGVRCASQVARKKKLQ